MKFDWEKWLNNNIDWLFPLGVYIAVTILTAYIFYVYNVIIQGAPIIK